jgi:hypothetical protein
MTAAPPAHVVAGIRLITAVVTMMASGSVGFAPNRQVSMKLAAGVVVFMTTTVSFMEVMFETIWPLPKLRVGEVWFFHVVVLGLRVHVSMRKQVQIWAPIPRRASF